MNNGSQNYESLLSLLYTENLKIVLSTLRLENVKYAKSEAYYMTM